MKIRNIIVSFAGSIAVMLSAAAFAAPYHDPGSCTNLGNGTVRCKGVFSDMASNTNIGFAYFSKSFYSNSTFMSFQMIFNGTMYSCGASPAMASVWDSIMASRNGDFSITLNPATGACISVTAYSSIGTM